MFAFGIKDLVSYKIFFNIIVIYFLSEKVLKVKSKEFNNNLYSNIDSYNIY